MITNKSMMIDNVYLESLVDGLTILGVTGRESLASTLTNVSVERRNGSIYTGKTYPSRNLTISFAIEGDSREDLTEKLDILNGILDEEDVNVIFRDEPDRFYNVAAFTNSSSAISYYPGSDAYIATGSFDAFCADPFKYSVSEYEAEQFIDPDTGYPSFVVDYNGNYKSYPLFKAFFYDESGINLEDDKMDIFEEIAETYRVPSYKQIDIGADDFTDDGYYTLDAIAVTTYNPDYNYYTLEEDETDGTKTYLLSDAIEFDGTETHYLINAKPATTYSPTATYFIEDLDYISDDDLLTDEFPDIDDMDGDINETNEDIGACGYVALIDDEENVLQFGNPEYDPHNEMTEEEKHPAVINNNFKSPNSFSSSVQAKWDVNFNSSAYLTDINKDRMLNPNSRFVTALSRPATYASNSTDQTIYNKTKNGVAYKVVVTGVSTRMTSSVKVSLKFTATLKNATIPAKSKKKKGTSLVAILSYNGNDIKKVTLCTEKSGWTKGKSKSATKTVTIGGLSTTTQDLSKFKLRVVGSGLKGSAYDFGNVALKACNIPIYIEIPDSYYYLKPTNLTGIKDKIYGTSISRLITDSNGVYGATRFSLDVTGKFCIGSDSTDKMERGILGVYVLGGEMQGSTLKNSYLMMGLEIVKTKDVANDATVRVFHKGEQIYKETNKYVTYGASSSFTIHMEKGTGSTFGDDFSVDFGTSNTVTKTTTTKKKTGTKKVTKKVKGKKTTVTKPVYKTVKKSKTTHPKYSMKHVCGLAATNGFDISGTQSSEGARAYRVVIATFNYSDNPPLEWCGIKSVKMYKYNDDMIDVNTFHTGQTLEVDCGAGEILIDGVSQQNYGALGNDWENMYLVPGVNQFSAVYSDWVTKSNRYDRCSNTEVFNPGTSYYVLQSGNYTRVDISELEFVANPTNYYKHVSYAPTFKLLYREVFI